MTTIERIIKQEIYCLQNHLVEHLLKSETIPIDDVENLYPEYSRWSMKQCRDWLTDHGIAWERHYDIDDLCDLIEDNSEPAEVMQWWCVSDWITKKFRDLGGVVIDNDFGTWWGRTGCGYSLEDEAILKQIASRLDSL